MRMEVTISPTLCYPGCTLNWAFVGDGSLLPLVSKNECRRVIFTLVTADPNLAITRLPRPPL